VAVTEESRHELYNRLQEAIGHDPATTLMESLPPVGWGEVATKQDLHAAVAPLATREDMYKLEARMVSRMNTQLLAVLGMNVSLYGLSFATLTLLR
jgi:hypothetical protein